MPGWRIGHIVADMLRAIDHVQQALAGKDQSALGADPILRAAVERFIEIVSEGSRHLPQEIIERYPEIPWRRVADIGNHLRHTYWMIEEDIVASPPSVCRNCATSCDASPTILSCHKS